MKFAKIAQGWSTALITVLSFLLLHSSLPAHTPPVQEDPPEDSISITLAPDFGSLSDGTGGEAPKTIFKTANQFLRITITSSGRKASRIGTLDTPWIDRVEITISPANPQAPNAPAPLVLKPQQGKDGEKLRAILSDEPADLFTQVRAKDSVTLEFFLTPAAFSALPEAEYQISAKLFPPGKASAPQPPAISSPPVRFVLGAPSTPQEQAAAGLRNYNVNMARFQFGLAIQNAQEVLQLGAQFTVRGNHFKAQALRERGSKEDLQQALEIYQQVLLPAEQEDPAMAQLIFKAPIELDVDAIQKAIADFDTPTPESVKQLNELLNEAHMLMADLQLNEALAKVNAASAVNPSHWEPHYYAGIILARQKKFPNARERLKKALDHIDEDPVINVLPDAEEIVKEVLDILE